MMKITIIIIIKIKCAPENVFIYCCYSCHLDEKQFEHPALVSTYMQRYKSQIYRSVGLYKIKFIYCNYRH